jgi:hypothetical protein
MTGIPQLQGRKIEEHRLFVTPEMASEWLKCNDHNRPVKSDKIAAFAEDMEIGEWRYVGDPIRFANKLDGTLLLLDGQNRLLALLRAAANKPDLTVEFKVEFGYLPEDQRYMDIGTARNLSDQLGLDGYPDSQNLAATARRVWNWEANGDPGSARSKVSPHVIRLLIVEKYDRLAPAARFGVEHKGGMLTASMHGLAYYILSGIDPEHAEWFLGRVEDGAELPSDHPVMVLRRRIIRDRANRGRAHEFYLMAYTFIAWNADRRGDLIKKIQLPKGGLSLETFPRPI